MAALERNLRVLGIGTDPLLLPELDAALSGIPDQPYLTFAARSLKEGVAEARSRQPDVICVEFQPDLRALTTFAREVGLVAPQASLVVAYNADQFSHGESEPAIIIELMRSRVHDFLRRPVSTTELRQLFDRIDGQAGALTAPRAGRVVSFVGNKGGVGKSTLSVNTACALAERHPGQVLIIDASLQLGVCALMLDLHPATTIADAVRERERLDESLLRRLTVPHECGLRLLAAPVDAIEAAGIDDASMSRIINLARYSFDYVVVDTFPMLDSVVMTILDHSDLAVVTFQGTAPCVAGLARFLPVLEALHVPPARLRLALNQNHRAFVGHLTPEDIESRIGRAIDIVLPYQKRLLPAMNVGRPYILGAMRRWGFGRAVMSLVTEIEGAVPGGEQAVSPNAPASGLADSAVRG